jgi:hypothetical protein
MKIRQWLALGALAGVIALGGVALAGSEDDLAVVKKAVGKDEPAPARSNARVARAETSVHADAQVEPAAVPRARRVRAGSEPQWLKVRILEKEGHKRNRVSVNLPLSLVRAIADDGDGFPIDWKCRQGGRRCEIDLRTILRSLEAGQELVEVDSDEATVKVWVE